MAQYFDIDKARLAYGQAHDALSELVLMASAYNCPEVTVERLTLAIEYYGKLLINDNSPSSELVNKAIYAIAHTYSTRTWYENKMLGLLSVLQVATLAYLINTTRDTNYIYRHRCVIYRSLQEKYIDNFPSLKEQYEQMVALTHKPQNAASAYFKKRYYDSKQNKTK
jgi:hypothetical protein